MMIRMDVEDRFWSKTDRRGPDECWLWQASVARGGYGMFRVSPTQNMNAHRWSYQHTFGALPSHIRVDHQFHCDRRCVNPAHLRAVTQKQNMENRSGAQANSNSGVRGVYWHKRARKWCAKVKHHQRNIHVGSFDDITDAEQAVIAKRLELFTHSDSR